MKILLTFFILLTSLYADKINKKTLACPSIESLKKAPLKSLEDPLALSMYAIANGCEVLAKKEHVEVLGYDPRNSQNLFQKIIHNKTGATLYLRSSAIDIEQGGKKNSIKF